MLGLKLYMAQRLSALIMVPFVTGHIIVMIYAAQGGLTAAEILGRTQDSMFWFLFYGTFVAAVSVHAAIGLRAIIYEWLGIEGRLLTGLTSFIGLLLFAMGAQAVIAVTVL